MKASTLALLGVCAIGLAAAAIKPDLPAAEAEARLAGPDSRFVEVDGMRVHYRDVGSGPVLVLLHGSNSSLHTWAGWIDMLSGDFRTVALDLPGHGLTGPNPTGSYSPDAQAEFLDHFTRAIGIERFALAGNSMGGQIAWHYALAHPRRLWALILVDPAGFPHRLPAVFALYRIPLLGRVATHVTPRFLVARSLRQVYGDASKVTPALVDRYYTLLLRQGNREATRRRFANRRPDSAVSELGEIAVPVLIQWGELDRWIPPEHARLFAERIRQARVRTYPRLGHVPMEEDPETTAADARDFLLEVLAESAGRS
ncbi:MAG: alpha/beta fold hydrolase [Candidatus Dadabacteria bacterium]|nr:MAG: alpha/beta fold hydrolase [Candidatus Dadabacteria bacterium]